MNDAQKKWKYYYRNFRKERGTTKKFDRSNMLVSRREAALERKIDAMQRTIEKLNKYLDDDSLEKAHLRIIIHNAGLKV